MRNVRLEMCYEGTRYKGWQRQSATDNTIQNKLETALSRILDEPIEVAASGRTDAGTHAKYQVVSFHCKSEMPCADLLAALRRYLPEDIGIYSCKNVSDRFHARLNAKTKTYVYRVWNTEQPCVFERKFVYVDTRAVELSAMQTAAKYFIGSHDFSAFCVNKNKKKSTIRCIYDFNIYRTDNEIIFKITGNGFLHHMVRIIVGTLLEVGRNERSADSIPDLFSAERSEAGAMIPACGLCLLEVTY